MEEALSYFYEIFSQSITFVFQTCNWNGVSVGWILISCVIIGMLIKSILNIPRGARLKGLSSVSYSDSSRTYDSNGNMFYHSSTVRRSYR